MATTSTDRLASRLAVIASGLALTLTLSLETPSPVAASQKHGSVVTGKPDSPKASKRTRAKRSATRGRNTRGVRRRAKGQRKHRDFRSKARKAGRRAGLGNNTAVSRPRRPSESDILLDAGFEQGLQNWNTAGVGEAVPGISSDIVRSGVRSSNVVLSGSQHRSELILGGNGGGGTSGMIEFREGDEYHYAFSFNVRSMVYGRPGAHNLIMQFKSDGEGSPAFGLQLWDYEGDEGDNGGRGLWSSGDAMGGDRFLAPLDERTWHDVIIHFRASSSGAGFYEVFLDGQLVDARSGVSMIAPGHSYAYIKNGLYRNGGSIPGTSEIRLDTARLGHSSGAVAPS